MFVIKREIRSIGLIRRRSGKGGSTDRQTDSRTGQGRTGQDRRTDRWTDGQQTYRQTGGTLFTLFIIINSSTTKTGSIFLEGSRKKKIHSREKGKKGTKGILVVDVFQLGWTGVNVGVQLPLHSIDRAGLTRTRLDSTRLNAYARLTRQAKEDKKQGQGLLLVFFWERRS